MRALSHESGSPEVVIPAGLRSKRERHSRERLALHQRRSVTVDLADKARLIRAAEKRGVGAHEGDEASRFETQRESPIERHP